MKSLEQSLVDTNNDLKRAEQEMELAEQNQNGKSVDVARSPTKVKNESKIEQNDLVMASDDEISISSLNDQCLFSKVILDLYIVLLKTFVHFYIFVHFRTFLFIVFLSIRTFVPFCTYEHFCTFLYSFVHLCTFVYICTFLDCISRG